jgi:hypothetical protein
MYKMLLFLKRSEDPGILKHFKDYTLDKLSNLVEEKVKMAKVESSLLMDIKYTWFCEMSVVSKEEWDKLLATDEGKMLNRDLADYHQFIDLIFVNYEEEL